MKRRASRNSRCGIALLACAGAVALSGCGPTRLNVKPEIPQLLMTPMPLTMGVRLPKSLTEYVQKEKTQQRQWEIDLGAGQAAALRSVTAAMFEHTLMLGDEAPGDAAAIAAHKLNAILETTLDSYVYLLPSQGGADYYSATIGYKVNLLSVNGTLLGSWIYEGYGSAPSKGLGSAKGVQLVTGLAIRDACANLAVHLPDQELVRDLLTAAAPTPTATGTPASAPEAKPGAEATPNTAVAPATDSAPESSAAPNPTASPSGPETTPKPVAVEVQPTTGN